MSGAVAERYAQAVFELGSEQNELVNLRDQMRDFATALSQNEELEQTLKNPLHPAAQRENLVKALAEKLGVSALGVRALLVIVRRGRLSALPEISTRLSQLVDESEGVIRASVVTATEMPDSYFSSLVSQLEKATNKKVVLERKVDSELIGGAVAQVGDSVLDASVRGRLEKFERQVLSALTAGTA